MNADRDTTKNERRSTRPTGICVLRSEPFDHGRLYSMTTNSDITQLSTQRQYHSADIDEVVQTVERFLRDTSD